MPDWVAHLQLCNQSLLVESPAVLDALAKPSLQGTKYDFQGHLVLGIIYGGYAQNF